MASPLQDALSRALSIRLGMQISLSALPVVEEWMDLHLTRWLESVPMPPELPSGHAAHFTVAFAADLSRLEWRAYGNPAGFVPKLVEYFEAIAVPRAELQLLDDIGTALEPALVGTWIGVQGGGIVNGWHFCDEHEVTGVAPFLAECPAKTALLGWVEEAGIERFRRFSQSLGDAPRTEIELPLPGMSPDDKLAAASRAFESLVGAPLPEPVTAAMVTAGSTEFTAAVVMEAGAVAGMRVLSPGLANDTVAALCAGVGVTCAAEHVRVQAALGVEAADRVAYTRLVPEGGDDGKDGAAFVDLSIVPTENTRPNPLRMN